ncbi:SH3 domain-containing protein [Microbacterium sp. NIBRBAC000506063]|uniref:SH3 domain-containing protein n=1 Tax=Microbacterium sp. NIBRBAC000506063 TaxID=2734618 RepID=UPI001BB4C655|nr:SH3 domain-containing protein [Microbacterium sp. NIBRBAC000506063]QTV79660.1 SH3 domain-containing protein [Microbacterium sp. NIBRBAC000506063]
MTTGAVNMRSSASTSGSVITLLAKGTSVRVGESSGSWRKVTAGSRTGWVHSDYLSGALTSRVTTGAVNMRSGPSTSNAVVTLIAKGTTVSVAGSQGSWRKVYVGTRDGWVHNDYLK